MGITVFWLCRLSFPINPLFFAIGLARLVAFFLFCFVWASSSFIADVRALFAGAPDVGAGVAPRRFFAAGEVGNCFLLRYGVTFLRVLSLPLNCPCCGLVPFEFNG